MSKASWKDIFVGFQRTVFQTFQLDLKTPGQKFESECLIMLAILVGRRKKIKYKMCSDGLRQSFPNLSFLQRAIFSLLFFPEIKTKIRSFFDYH